VHTSVFVYTPDSWKDQNSNEIESCRKVQKTSSIDDEVKNLPNCGWEVKMRSVETFHQMTGDCARTIHDFLKIVR
jgi:hypothetical protein